MVRGYARLDSRQMDAIWDQLQAGHAAKPVARAMGLSTGTVRTYLLRCGGSGRRRGVDVRAGCRWVNAKKSRAG